jgi:hypothetical protein
LKHTKAQVGLGNVANERQYSTSNKPTPADIGAVTLQQAFNAAHPVGDVYIQYPSCAEPATLYNVNGITSTWQNVSASYANYYPRVEGDRGWYGSFQGDGLPNLTGQAGMVNNTVGLIFDTYNGGGRADGVFFKGDSKPGYPELTESNIVTRNLSFDASRSNGIYGAATYVRPATVVVRIWKRTA